MKITRGFAGLIPAALLLAACGSGDPRGDDAVAWVAEGHANAPAAALVGELIPDVDRAVRNQDTAAVVVNSGRPAVLTQGRLSLDCHNGPACDQAITNTISLVTTTVQTATADAPENNLLAAIDLAARSLRDHSGTKTMGVIDSGLQTVPPLPFQQPGLLEAAPEEVADFLDQHHLLPDLTGIDVVFSGLGDVTPPQQQLGIAQQANLRAIWVAIARKAHAASVRVIETPLPTTPPRPGLPPVSVVTVDPGPTMPVAATPPAGPATPPPCIDRPTVDLPDTKLHFQPDTATLANPGDAQTILTDLAHRITAEHDTVTITGTTARVGPDQGQRDLGQARAETIKALLVQLGIPAPQITTRTVGSDWPGYTPDHDQTGALLPGQAELNRHVLVELDPPACPRPGD